MKSIALFLAIIALPALSAQAACKDCGCREKCSPKCTCKHEGAPKAQ